jgi:hypothetical protein
MALLEPPRVFNDLCTRYSAGWFVVETGLSEMAMAVWPGQAATAPNWLRLAVIF